MRTVSAEMENQEAGSAAKWVARCTWCDVEHFIMLTIRDCHLC
jgi:hypothetical protein